MIIVIISRLIKIVDSAINI